MEILGIVHQDSADAANGIREPARRHVADLDGSAERGWNAYLGSAGVPMTFFRRSIGGHPGHELWPRDGSDPSGSAGDDPLTIDRQPVQAAGSVIERQGSGGGQPCYRGHGPGQTSINLAPAEASVNGRRWFTQVLD